WGGDKRGAGEQIGGANNKGVVRVRCLSHAKALYPRRALSIAGKWAVDVGSADASTRRNRPFRRSVRKPSERPRAVRPFGQAHVHLVARERDAVAGRAAHRLKAFVCGQNRLNVEQAEAIRGTSASFDSMWIPYGASQHLISAAQS